MLNKNYIRNPTRMNANALAQEGSARDESASKTAYGDCLDEVLFFFV